MNLHITGEPLRVVRPLRDGEKMPRASTLDLLLGVSVTSVPTPRYKPGPPKGAAANAGSKKAARDRTEKAEALFRSHHDTIKKMILNLALNAEISEATGLSHFQLNKAINLSKELRALSRKRLSAAGRACSVQRSAKSKNRFETNKTAIYAMLKTHGVSAAAKEFRFDYDTFKRHLEREKNAQG